MPVFQIHHVTRYEYDHPVRESNNQIRIYPVADANQEILSHRLALSHKESPVEQYTDYFGNTVGVFNVLESHNELVIDSQLVVRTKSSGRKGQDGHLSAANTATADAARDMRLLDYSQPEKIQAQGEIMSILDAAGIAGATPGETVFQCSAFIFNNFQYIKGITDVETTVDEILAHRSGVCQDFAHVLLQLLRTAGIPARYVSGYICPNRDGVRGEGATHAWVEAWVPGQGWAGIDPTNNIWVEDTHVKLAVGRHFSDCTPMKGAFKGPANQHLSVYVSVAYEDGHVSKEHTQVQMHRATTPVPPLRDSGAAQQ